MADLRSGIASADIVDMLAGEVDGEPVLVVRHDGALYAVGGTCTHYGAPLADGIVADGTVRCPWHHACFDLRTGLATRAPALNPIATYEVEERDGRIIVGAKREVPQPARVHSRVRSVGIVGAGAAGSAAAEGLRREGFDGAIALIGAEETLAVDRPNLSKDYLAGHAPEEWMVLRGDDFYREHQIEAVTGRRAVRLDARTKTLTFADGSSRAYDAIVLATGAEPVRLTPAGGATVHVLRTLADSRAIIAKAEKGRRAIVLGSSFIGLEVAAALRAREVDVTVVGPETIPLARVLGVEVGAWIRRLHESNGVRFRLGTTVSTFERDRVVLASGEPLAADFIVAGVGVRPNVQLAESAGLVVNEGIVVDEFLETSVPGIFAAGDVARYPDPYSGHRVRVEHWVAAGQQGRTAARNIVGRNRTPHRVPPFFWSAHYDAIVAYVGNAHGFDRAELHGSLDDRRAAVAYRIGGRIAAVATIGLDRESLLIEKAMEEGNAAEVERIAASV